MQKLPYLNLGCGFHYNNKFTNLDFIKTGDEVIAHNLLSGIPFNNETFKLVYHSHILEHFGKIDAISFIKECCRVLQKDGIIRIAVPDLEPIARNYIKYLDECFIDDKHSKEKYNWTMLELFDQTTRHKGGGDMIEYIKDETKNNDAFLLHRNGNEVKLLFQNVRNKQNINSNSDSISNFQKVKNFVRKFLIKNVLKINEKALEIGEFRLGGEIHQWMYDRYSLKLLLENNGFKNIVVVDAFKSNIDNWASFELDSINGEVRKPDSLFIEAQKK